MRTVKENTTLVGLSELRTKAEEILKVMDRSTVVIEQRHRPRAVLLSIQRYEKMEALLDAVEDQILGSLAKEREKGTARKAYLSLEEAEQRLKKR